MSPARFALIGHPLGHSLSPAIHGAAYRALGLAHRYELCECAEPSDVKRAFARLRLGEYQGLNVTLPWKSVALVLSDRADPLARDTGAANVLAAEGDDVVAYNTDVLALVDELVGLAPGARQALVIGSGGAALAAVGACRQRGLSRVGVVARRFRGDAVREDWPNRQLLQDGSAELLAWPEEDPHARSLLADFAVQCDLVIQASSAGMRGGEDGGSVAEVVPWTELAPSAVALDVVYTPAVTPFLARAREHGLLAEGGLGMLVGQAAHALRIWLDVEPPRAAMTEAALRALSEAEP